MEGGVKGHEEPTQAHWALMCGMDSHVWVPQIYLVFATQPLRA